MAKQPEKYLNVDPWMIIENGFHRGRSRVSESIFSLGNEYMGIRGYFEEGYSGDTLQGAYFNGVYEYRDIQHPTGREFQGMVHESHFMVNAHDWLHTRIECDGEILDLAKSKFSRFSRWLDMRSGVMGRSFVWHIENGGKIEISFERLLSMRHHQLAAQRVSFKSLGFEGKISLSLGMDYATIHEEEQQSFWTLEKKEIGENSISCLSKTLRSGHKTFSNMRLDAKSKLKFERADSKTTPSLKTTLKLKDGDSTTIDRIVVNHVEKSAAKPLELVWEKGAETARLFEETTWESALAEQKRFWNTVWKQADIEIEGDPENQQGVRFCIFQLTQSYHGVDSSLNVSAKGLTGEKYSGWTWWDTETYCLPFYMFTNPKAAKNLLTYRRKTLKGALKRAKELDCQGARFPMATINGEEAVGVWQHGDLEIHVSAAVAFGFWHYERVTGDEKLVFSKGIDVLLEICKYYESRGNWGQKTGKFGFFGVMGADEFHMMVNNNCYTNAMAKKAFEYTLDVVRRMEKAHKEKIDATLKKHRVDSKSLETWKRLADNMDIPMDQQSGVYEQHEGFFNLPHVDVNAIPPEQLPLYKHWAYVRIFRYDMTKQPDVLMLHFLFNGEYSRENKLANYLYYEPRCSHESSLSPSIHSILAAELDMDEKAYSYLGHATRLDLDDYNRNTSEGLHTTSMAAAWMNIAYGFGGMRSDGETLSFNPKLPENWTSYKFRIKYRGTIVEVAVKRGKTQLRTIKGAPINIEIHGKPLVLDAEGIQLETAILSKKKGTK